MSIEILILAFEKAEKEIGSGKKTHLAQHLSDLLLEEYGYTIHERTLRDYYTNYKKGKTGTQDDLKTKLTACLCNYLGYADYADYVENNSLINDEVEKDRDEGSSKTKWPKYLIIILGVVLVSTWILKKQIQPFSENKCMAWADSLYVKVSCTTKPYSEFGTPVEPLDEMKLKNFKKVDVSMATQFFAEDGKPLIWYYKNKDKEIEYYTAPGLHPITEKTLDEITEYIIEKYVPVHSNKEGSFIKED